MKGRSINILVLLVFLVIPASAQARTTLALPDGSTPYPEQGWVDNARVPTPDMAVTYTVGPCPTMTSYTLGCVDWSESTPHIYVDLNIWDRRRVLLHEVGHVFAWQHNIFTEGIGGLDRVVERRFLKHAKLEGPGIDRVEAFAVAYEFCAVFGNRVPRRILNREDNYHGYILRKPSQRRVCRFIRTLQHRTALEVPST